VPVKVLEWIAPALASLDLVLEAQPPAQRKRPLDPTFISVW